MDSIIDIAQSRKARREKGDLFKESANDLLFLLEKQRTHISEEFMTFLLALGISDQALHYAGQSQDKRAGEKFLEHLFETARQIFETHKHGEGDKSQAAPARQPRNFRLIRFRRRKPAK